MNVQPQSFEEKIEQFSKFISLLSGELDVSVSFGGKKDGKSIVLPDISGFDEKRLNFLYALCLREAGVLAKSHRKMISFVDFKTSNQIFAAITVESGRIERYLVRKFGGAAEILENHWGFEAHDKDLSSIAFGFDPKSATLEQTFFSAVKWSQLGYPKKFFWENLFPKEHWERSVGLLSEPDFEMILKTPLRSWNDAKNVGAQLLEKFYQKTATQDNSHPIVRSEKMQKWEEAQKALSEDLPNLLKPLLEQKEALLEQVKKLQEEQAQKLEDQGIDLKQMRKDFKGVRQENSALKSVAKPLNKLEKTQERSSLKEENLNQFHNRTQEKLENQQNRQDKIEERAEEMRQKAQEKERAALEKEEQALADLLEKEQSLLNKIQEIDDKIQEGKASEAQLEKLIEKKKNLEEKINALHQKEEAIHQKSENALESAQKAMEKAESLESKKEDVAEKAQSQAQTAAEREAQLKEEIESLKNQAAKLQEDLDKAAKESGLDLNKISPKELSEKIAKTQSKQDQMSEKISELAGDQSKIKNLAEQVKNLDKEARTAAHKVTRDIQEKMDKAGIECNICEKLDEMEGWDAANEAQQKFDEKASEELGQPVINGSGGGRGHRDLLTEIQEKAKGIGEIDPNDIFADVARLSPLSGFSETGSRDGEGGLARGHKETTIGSFIKSRHSVWSKQFDKVENALDKDARHLQKMRQELALPLKKVKQVFALKMKPSFKIRFKGGREEGDLDGRAIWKLAAGQGEDFYETSFKRAEKKSSAIVLSDLSGSCSSWGDEVNEKIQGLSLLLSDGLDAAHIDHEVLGYFAPIDDRLSAQNAPSAFNRKTCRLETMVVKGFNEKSLVGLKSMEVKQADNSDGESLRIAIDRLRRRPGKTKLIFMISDGKPFMHDAQTEILDEDLRSALYYAASQKVVVWGLGFSPNHPVFGDQYIALKDLNDLSAQLEKRL